MAARGKQFYIDMDFAKAIVVTNVIYFGHGCLMLYGQESI
jgi:hypothetical protein